jgi:hypothetical protein
MRTPHRRLSVASLPKGKCVDGAAVVQQTKAGSAWRSAGAASALALFVAATVYGCGLPLGGLQADDHSTFPEDASSPIDPPDATDPPDAPSGDDGGPDDGATIDVTVPPDPVHEGGREDHADANPPVTDAPTESNVEGGPPDGAPEAGPDARPDAPPDAPPDGPPPPPPPPPTFIQQASAVPAQATTFSATLLKAQTAGNMNVVAIGWADSTTNLVSVTDGAGNTYVPAVGPTIAKSSVFDFTQWILYAPNITASPAGNAITVTFDASASAPDLRVGEYAGLDSDDPVDVTAAVAGTGLLTTAGPVTTHEPALLVAANMVAMVTIGPGLGFTQRIKTSPDSDILEDRYVPMPGAYSATAPVDDGVVWIMQLVAFRVK